MLSFIFSADKTAFYRTIRFKREKHGLRAIVLTALIALPLTHSKGLPPQVRVYRLQLETRLLPCTSSTDILEVLIAPVQWQVQAEKKTPQGSHISGMNPLPVGSSSSSVAFIYMEFDFKCIKSEFNLTDRLPYLGQQKQRYVECKPSSQETCGIIYFTCGIKLQMSLGHVQWFKIKKLLMDIFKM